MGQNRKILWIFATADVVLIVARFLCARKGTMNLPLDSLEVRKRDELKRCAVTICTSTELELASDGCDDQAIGR